MNVKELTTQDGVPLTIREFIPRNETKAFIVLAPAMGAAQSYYQPFASWLSNHGFHVTTFDYRGMGESRIGHLKHYDTDILDWAEIDCSAVLADVLVKSGQFPTYWIGHSLGGQIFPLIKDIEKVSKVITVASGTGYWRHNAPQLKKKVWWFWFFVVPTLLKVYGYFPGKKIGMVGNLPKPVMQQWRKWCMHPEYCVGVENNSIRQKFEQVSVPIRSVALADDEMLSSKNISGLFSLFGSQDKQLTTINPEEFGIKRIGHLGFFRSEFAENLWPQTLLHELVPD